MICVFWLTLCLVYGQLIMNMDGSLTMMGVLRLNSNTYIEREVTHNVSVMLNNTSYNSTSTDNITTISNATDTVYEITTTITAINLADELAYLRAELAAQRLPIEQLRQQRSCSWTGIRCQCYYKFSASLDDYLILLGSNCTNGRLVDVRVLNMLVASQINGCIFNTTAVCDEMAPS